MLLIGIFQDASHIFDKGKKTLRTKIALIFIPPQVLPTSIFQDKYLGFCLSCKNFNLTFKTSYFQQISCGRNNAM